LTSRLKKGINNKLIVDRALVPYVGETGIRAVTNEGDQPKALADWNSK